jgi:hypothetical protein
VITGTQAGDASQPLLGGGLTVIDTAPVALPDVTAGAIDEEGPLALDYRAWGKQVESPRMAVPHDVTYENTKKVEISYDGKKYEYGIHTVADK